jgi:hypothetical protein
MITRLQSIGFLIFTLVALYAMQHTTPYYSDILSPVTVSGVQGKAVETSRFAVGVGNFYRAKELIIPGISGDRVYTTEGEWLVIEAAAKAKIDSMNLMSVAWLGPNGVRYGLSGRLSTASGVIGTERFEPGIPRPTLIIFEVPSDQVRGGKLLVAESALVPLSEELRISLNDDKANPVNSSIEIGRGDRVMAWRLEVKK